MTDLQTFRGNTSAEAIEQVKAALGKDAVILHTRTVDSGGLLGLGSRKIVEITASSAPVGLPHRPRQGILREQTEWSDQQEGTSGAVVAETAAVPLSNSVVVKEIAELRALVRDFVRRSDRERVPAVPDGLLDVYQSLLENQVAQELADQIVQEVGEQLDEEGLRSPQIVRRKLADRVAAMVPSSGGITVREHGRPTVIAIVGPTGVGKTTTVAKLAAILGLRQGRSVGLISLDSSRIAAVDQLKTYARIINVPMKVAMTANEVRSAVGEFGDRDVILLDTAGQSPRDEVGLRELGCLLAEASPDEVHLALSATCSRPVMETSLERFAPLGIDRLIFTKLDEAVGFGVILTCLARADTRLSYLTTGQDIPNDLEVGAEDRIAELIVSGCYSSELG